MEAEGEQTPIDASAATPPSLRRTWPIVLVTALVCKILGRKPQPSVATQAGESDDGESGISTDGPEVETPDQERDRKDNKSGKIGPATMKGGARRRKAVRK